MYSLEHHTTSKKIQNFSLSKVMEVCRKSGCEIKYNISYKKIVKICCPLNDFFPARSLNDFFQVRHKTIAISN